MSRMNLKRPFKHKKQILVIILLLFLFFIFKNLTNNIANYFLKASESQVNQITTALINNSVTNDDLNDLKFEDLYYINKNSKNEIEMIDYNSIAVNKFLNNITKNIQKSLLDVESGNLSSIGLKNTNGILFYIPFGSITGNPILNNSGPKIPVRIKNVGSLLTNINVNIKEYGINNCLIEMVVYVEIKQQILLPLVSKQIKITNEVPIAYKLINGKIPYYYSGSGINKSSSIYSIPIE